MSNILKVTLPLHLDSEKITAFVANEIPVEIEITNDYAGQIASVTKLSINNLSPAELEALLIVVDKLTGTFEIGTYVFKVEKNVKTFTLTDSYFRDEETIPKPAVQIPVGTALMARFEIPGFEINSFREMPIYYKSAFNPADLDLLQEIGIMLSGDGSGFSISNEVDCKVSFFKPETSEVEYIVDFQLFNEIIPADE